MKTLYNLLLHLLLPFIVLRLLIKSRKNPTYRKHIHERFAYKLPACPNHPLWIHTVSVGEFLAIRPLLDTLCAHHPDLPLWLSCTTPTGRAQIQQWAKNRTEAITISYLPYDTPSIVRRFYQHLRPRGAIFMETEIWPNILRAAQQRKTPCLLINARLSAKSLRGYYRYARTLLNEPLSHLYINAQSAEDAKRFRTLNSNADIHVTPNLKYAAPSQATTALTDFIPEHTPLLLAASTHSGEESLILDSWIALQEQQPHLALCLAPRHPERRAEIIKLIKERGYNPILRSQKQSLAHPKDIAILDTLGELKRAYASADIAIIGGSFITHGGHNPLEALQQGTPICFGPSMYNFSAISRKLIQHPFARQTDATQLGATILELQHYLAEHGREPILRYSQQQSSNVLAQHYHYLQQHLALAQTPQSN